MRYHDAKSLAGFLSLRAGGRSELGTHAILMGLCIVISQKRSQLRLPPHPTSRLRRSLLVEGSSPLHNGMPFFNEGRSSLQLYTDACPTGVGGFFSLDTSCPWHSQLSTLNVVQAFASHIPPEFSQPIAVHEAQAILLALRKWSSAWCGKRVIIFTDNTNVFDGLRKGYIKGKAKVPIRDIRLLANARDIIIEPRWLSSQDNGLADALFRFNWKLIANLVPSWQGCQTSVINNPPDPAASPLISLQCRSSRALRSTSYLALVRPEAQNAIRLYLRRQILRILLLQSTPITLAGYIQTPGELDNGQSIRLQSPSPASGPPQYNSFLSRGAPLSSHRQ